MKSRLCGINFNRSRRIHKLWTGAMLQDQRAVNVARGHSALLVASHSFLFLSQALSTKSLIPMTHVEIPSQGQHSFSFDRLPGRGAAENGHRALNDVAAMTGGRTLWSRSRSQLPCPCLSASRNQK